MNTGNYEFLDCGNQRRLERIDGVLVSRPAPAATHRPALPGALWSQAGVSFEKGSGWTGEAPEGWHADIDGVCLGLRLASGGQIGIFPEHARPAEKILELVSRQFEPVQPLSALNLFAHTGLMTLRLASRPGTSVAHVDSAGSAVKMAKNNALLSGLQDCPIRWLVNDAMKFCRKEQKRGQRYEIVVADPPSFGRGNKGESWKLERDLGGLLDVLYGLLTPNGIVCLTCHSEGWTQEALRVAVGGVTGKGRGGRMESEELALHSRRGGKSLRTGSVVYCIL